MKMRMAIIMGVILISLAALVLTTGGMKQDSILIVDTHTVGIQPDKFQGREIRMRGFVRPGSILRYGDRADFEVSQTDPAHPEREVVIPVHFTGETQLPDTFEDGARVRVDGVLDGSNRLVATHVEAKCASKYEAEYAERSAAEI